MKFSIITPVYNRADCIVRCMESVTKNVGGRIDVEHIVVDDGSIDETPHIVNQYAISYSHVVFHSFPQNRGTNAARNEAIKNAKGKWCVILDSDDYWDENALKIIDETVDAHPEIRHFCFAPDDMQSYYENNRLIAGRKCALLTFEDFLMGRVSGDFVHVIQTDILRQYPFDENLRIYEGVFFLSFYKEAQNILFTNRIVSHRERGRDDSVSYEFLRTNRTIVERIVQAGEVYESRFTEDLSCIIGGEDLLWHHQLALLENYVLLGEYGKARKLLYEIKYVRLRKVPLRLILFCKLRLGGLYFTVLRFHLYIKYRILNKRLK